MKLRLHDHKVPRSFVALEVTTPERIVNKGSVAGIYGDADYGRGSYCSPAPACFFAPASLVGFVRFSRSTPALAGEAK
jgi:hypothetical protein